jgi:hypothetical protein
MRYTGGRRKIATSIDGKSLGMSIADLKEISPAFKCTRSKWKRNTNQ